MQEYFPKDISIDINTKTATITVQSQKVLEDIMSKYIEMMKYRNPEYILWKCQPINPEFNPYLTQKYLYLILIINFNLYNEYLFIIISIQENDPFNPNMMFNQFSNLSVFGNFINFKFYK